MTGKASSDFNDWTALWGDAQQKYWQTWADLAGKAGPGPAAAANPWTQGFDLWAKALGGAAPAESRDWIGKLTDVNKGFLAMGEQIWKSMSSTPSAPNTPEAWWAAVSQGLRQMQGQFTAPPTANQDPWAGFAALWGMPNDTWRRVASACSAIPGDMEKALRGFGTDGGSEFSLNRLLSIPSLGYTREWQDEWQVLQQKWLEHAKAMQAYSRILERITTRATEVLGKKLTETGEAAKPPATLREFYNLWVDCGEEAYAEAAPTTEFVAAQAELVNTLMAVKRQEQKMVDEVLAGLNMPTRRELDTAHRRVHQLQRQLWEIKESHADDSVRSLREEVAALQRTVESLRAHIEQPAAAKPSTRAAKASN